MNNASGWVRQALVVFQFMIAITLICGMIVISNQLSFMQEKDLGFDSKAKIILPLRTDDARKQYESLKKELQNSSDINSISGAHYIPGTQILNDFVVYPDGGSMETAILHRFNRIDAGYMELLDIKLKAGRTLSENRETEKGKIIINETSAKKLGFTAEESLGRKLYFDWQGTRHDFEIVGVMEDFHQNSLKETINPTIFELAQNPDSYSYMIASVNASHFKQTIGTIENIWKKLVNATPFEYTFLDENIQKQYQEDRKVSGIITAFTVIAMIICSLGLYGLSTYMAERRYKEIGVRKVMGANVGQIVGMMSQEFIRLVIIAFVISVPVAWFAMNAWLNGFAYHVTLSVWVFVFAGLAALTIALLTVSYESFMAASANPVNSLRNE